jgi:hypothetical protein
LNDVLIAIARAVSYETLEPPDLPSASSGQYANESRSDSAIMVDLHPRMAAMIALPSS